MTRFAPSLPLLALALLALPALPSALAQTAPAPVTAPVAAPTGQKVIDTITVTSNKGYSIKVPSGWTPLKNAPNVDVAFVNEVVGALRPTVTVQVRDTPPELKVTLADIRDLYASQMPKDVPNLKMLGEKIIRISGQNAILWSYSGDGDGGKVRWTQVLTIKNNRLYTATLITPTNTPQDLLDSGRAIIDSFALTAK
ncbi:PsbP-related protein [Deinococcus marmoris]|uniref:PsbP-related protein n=2 Tax=Deinococcus marmoris TaxID=249408 RepID=UPI0004971EF4|nr:PsbP-related protein [Deinococcus marmoris]